MPSARSITSGSSAGQTECWVNGCQRLRRSRATRSAVRSVVTAPRLEQPRLGSACAVAQRDRAERTGLSDADLDWLHLLLADWQLLADLSFADLVLWLPLRDRGGFVAGAQMRPTTGPTVYHDDVVGIEIARGRRAQIDTAYDEGRICRESDPDWPFDVPVREETIPVRRAGAVIAVVSRHTNLAAARTPSRLELTYLRSADDLARMVADGAFPVAHSGDRVLGSPRVGDGLIRLDEQGIVTFASPNALSAYRRLGVSADLVGLRLGDATTALQAPDRPVDEALESMLSGRAARQTEVEAAGGHRAAAGDPADPRRHPRSRAGALS